MDYRPEHAKVIEAAYVASALAVRLDIDGRMYEVDFHEYRQVYVEDPTKCRRVKRHGGAIDSGPRLVGAISVTSFALGVRVRLADGSGGIGRTIGIAKRGSVVEVLWDDGTKTAHTLQKKDLLMAPSCPPDWSAGASDIVRQTRLQKALFRNTYQSERTIDRLKRSGVSEVPAGYRVRTVYRNQNRTLWARYFDRRNALAHKCQPGGGAQGEMWPWKPIKTMQCLPDAMRLNSRCNEVYLFHGSKLQALQSIFDNGFDVSKAKDGLLGRRIYFAESVTKADEYCCKGATFGKSDLFALLICRVCLGKALYTCDVVPKSAGLDENIKKAGADSVVAERPSGYRELVVSDMDQAFPEFLVYFERVSAPLSAGNVVPPVISAPGGA